MLLRSHGIPNPKKIISYNRSYEYSRTIADIYLTTNHHLEIDNYLRQEAMQCIGISDNRPYT